MSKIISIHTDATRADYDKWNKSQKDKIINRPKKNIPHHSLDCLMSDVFIPEYLKTAFERFTLEFHLRNVISKGYIPVSYLLIFVDTCLNIIPVVFADEKKSKLDIEDLADRVHPCDTPALERSVCNA